MKVEFELEEANVVTGKMGVSGKIKIVGKAPKNLVYVVIDLGGEKLRFIQDKDLKIFATNILKALKNKK